MCNVKIDVSKIKIRSSAWWWACKPLCALRYCFVPRMTDFRCYCVADDCALILPRHPRSRLVLLFVAEGSEEGEKKSEKSRDLKKGTHLFAEVILMIVKLMLLALSAAAAADVSGAQAAPRGEALLLSITGPQIRRAVDIAWLVTASLRRILGGHGGLWILLFLVLTNKTRRLLSLMLELVMVVHFLRNR